MPTTSGIGIGVIEIAIYLWVGFILRDVFHSLKKLNIISYLWLLMTVLTGIWEFAFISQYKEVHDYAETFVQNNTHVWTTRYDLSYVNPWKLSRIFYAEYGAHADREYIALDNHWSRVIEGSHAILCGLFATLALYFKSHRKNKLFVISATVAMSTQLMNSILYMAQYFYQMRDPNSVNYPSAEFPAGFALWERAFMYVNVFWTLMPLYVIIMEYILYGKEWVGLLLDIEEEKDSLLAHSEVGLVYLQPNREHSDYFKKCLTKYRISVNMGYVSTHWLWRL